MTDLIEALNQCSPARTAFYVIAGLIALGIVGSAFTDALNYITLIFRKPPKQ